MNDEDLLKAFTSMGMEEEGEGFMPMMQGMMKTLLSKEILYPSLKELSQKVCLHSNIVKDTHCDFQTCTYDFKIL